MRLNSLNKMMIHAVSIVALIGSMSMALELETSRDERLVGDPLDNSDDFSLLELVSGIQSRVQKVMAGPAPPGSLPREVSETDLYLLSAIEKLAHRLKFLEEKVKRHEDLLYYAMSGSGNGGPACPANFTRAGNGCYYFSSFHNRRYNWKAATAVCSGMNAKLAELETIEENQDVVASIQGNPSLRGNDFWTGGLNPGLLWMWANSARPVSPDKPNKGDPDIRGSGRCLKLAYSLSSRSYAYEAAECSTREFFICEYELNSTKRRESAKEVAMGNSTTSEAAKEPIGDVVRRK